MDAPNTQSRRHLLTDDEILFFMHIPKTAGTTFTETLKNRFVQEAFCPAIRWHEILEIPPSEFASYRLIAGHMSYGLYRHIPRPLVYITMFRDPVERVISQYENSRRGIRRYPYKKLFTQNLSFYDYMVDPELNIASTNVAVRMIGENYSLEQIALAYAVRDYDDDFVEPPDIGPVTELLARAKERLEQFAFVGITERFLDSMNLLSYTLGWSPVHTTQELNKAPKRMRREDLSQVALDAVIERNQADIELYDFARNLFEQRYNDMVLELLDKDYQSLYPYSADLIDTWVLNYKDKIQGAGWHPPDPETPGIRWTGPGTVSTIDLRLKHDQTLVLTFRIVTALAQDILDSFRVEINRRPAPLQVEAAGTQPGIYLSVLATPELLTSDLPFTRISFHVNRTVRPQDVLPGNIDERRLGVAIADFRIAPASD